jgi:hypothetical protein
LPNQFISSSKFQLLVDKKELRKALRKVGNDLKKTAKALILAPKSGIHYGKHVASLPGEAPASLTGALSNSMKVSVKKDTLKVTDTSFYALMLEAGAHGGGRAKGGKSGKSTRKYVRGNNTRVATTDREVAPRPFLSEALKIVPVQTILDASLKNIITKRTTF